MDANLEKLTTAHGEVKQLVSPSGFSFVIREQNGNDDDVLSNGAGALDGTSAANFLSGIVVKTDYTSTSKLSQGEAMSLKLCDKYFLVIASRIFSIGQSLKFEYEWPDLSTAVSYEEDLGLYIWDYGDTKNKFPEEGHKEYQEFRIAPHPHGKNKELEFSTSTNKVMKFTFSNSYSEQFLGSLSKEKQSKNNELKSRKLSQKIQDRWVEVESFRNYTTTEMREIRNAVFDADPILEVYSEIEHPNSKATQFLPILGQPDFFYPREV